MLALGFNDFGLCLQFCSAGLRGLLYVLIRLLPEGFVCLILSLFVTCFISVYFVFLFWFGWLIVLCSC